MGKKNKKFKKKKQYSAPTQNLSVINDQALKETGSETISSAPKEENSQQFEDKEHPYIRTDIRKILFIMIIIILFTIGLYFLDQKTSYLYQAGDWLYKIFNIKTQ